MRIGGGAGRPRLTVGSGRRKTGPDVGRAPTCGVIPARQQDRVRSVAIGSRQSAGIFTGQVGGAVIQLSAQRGGRGTRGPMGPRGPKGRDGGSSDLVETVLRAGDPGQQMVRIEAFVRDWCSEQSVLYPNREVAAVRQSLDGLPSYFQQWLYHECALNVSLARLVCVTCHLLVEDSPLRNDPEIQRLMQSRLVGEQLPSILSTLRSAVDVAWQQYPDPSMSLRDEWPSIRDKIKTLPVLLVENLRARGMTAVTLFLLHRLGATQRRYPAAE